MAVLDKINHNNLPILLGLSTGTFPNCTDADASLKFALRKMPGLKNNQKQKLRRLYANSYIQTRHLAIPDFLEQPETRFFTNSFATPIEKRLEHAIEIALPYVCDVAEKALKEANIEVDDVAQLVVVTSTAMGSPGIDQLIFQRLGLPNNVMRACVNFMGCAAGVTGLRMASDFVKGLDRGRSNLVSLLICLETSSVHTSMDPEKKHIITHSLFADGIACSVIGCREKTAPEASGKLAILDFESLQLADCIDGIQLRIQQDGISCLLSKDLPKKIASGVRQWQENLLKRSNLKINDLSFWAIHPGGRKIIEKSIEGLGIAQDDACNSWEILKDYGNVLSCGIFYVIRKMLDKGHFSENSKGVAFSFSPGVSVEGVLLEFLPKQEQQPSRTKLKIKKRDGIVVPDWAPDNLVESLSEVDKRPDDITVVTYPKSGTTWMLQIIHLLLNDGEQGETPLNEAVGWYERDPVSKLNNLTSRRLIKTHLPLRSLPMGHGKQIYLARNAKDVAVSYYYHARAKEDFDFLGDWDTFFELFINGEVEGGDWFNHINEGIVHAESDNVLLVWYEQMHADLKSVIRRVAKYIDVEVSDYTLQAILKKSSFDYMIQSPFTNVQWSKERDGEAPHLRSGTIGGWQLLFSNNQVKNLNDKWLIPKNLGYA